jgi:hypothetical protein
MGKSVIRSAALAGSLLLMLALSGCVESGPGGRDEAVQSSDEITEEMILSDLKSFYPGYPMLVSVESLDPRMQREYAGMSQVVALLPAVYMPYNPGIPDLDRYLMNPSGIKGNCIMIEYLEEGLSFVGKYVGGYSCDSDYYPGSDEPPLD